jgi:hypothetical protein
MKNRADERFGRLTVKRFHRRDQNWNYFWWCSCDCGNEVIVQYSNLANGSTRSCGCLKRETTAARSTKHGRQAGGNPPLRLYGVWKAMRSRCNTPTHKDFRYYAAFEDWALANGYKGNLSIDRINNDGNYEPSNCRWVTREVQAQNRRSVNKEVAA